MGNWANVLIIDDELGPRESLKMILKPTCNVYTAENGDTALELIRKNHVDLVTLDMKMPGMPGIEVLKEIKEYNSDIEVVVLTGYGNLDNAIEALKCGALDYITKPFDVNQIKEIVKEGLKKYKSLIRLQEAIEQTVYAVALTVGSRDPYTAGHQRRVAGLAREIAAEMGLSEDQIYGIKMAGEIHDLGKTSIPGELLSKPTRLTDAEFSLIKTHSQVGYEILNDIEFPWPIAQAVLQHHEKIDGSGYPQGLPGKDILIEARILSAADVVEAMASHRPYRPALGMNCALAEISKNKGVLYDPKVVDICLTLFTKNGFEFK